MSLRDFIVTRSQAAVQAAGRKFGLEIRRTGPSARDDIRLARFLAAHGIDVVLDIGANRGQFAAQLFANGFAGQIVSFEALPEPHRELRAAAAHFGKRWRVAPALALSDGEGSTSFHLNDSDATSSMLAASEDALQSIPGMRPRSRVDVPTRRLDCIIDDYVSTGQALFLKIDVQGGEGLVLAGAQATLSRTAGLVIELSLSELYAGQPMAFDVLAPLLALGFAVHDITPAYRDESSHRLRQIDVVLFRADHNGSMV